MSLSVSLYILITLSGVNSSVKIVSNFRESVEYDSLYELSVVNSSLQERKNSVPMKLMRRSI